MMSMPSHDDDSAAESCWQWRYRVLLATVLPSPTGGGAAEATLVMT
jgi:hypothetical protein